MVVVGWAEFAAITAGVGGVAPAAIKKFVWFVGCNGMELKLLANDDDVDDDDAVIDEEANNRDDGFEVVFGSLNKFWGSIESKKGFANAAPVAKLKEK